MIAALYARVSSARQAAEGLSLDEQVIRCRARIDAEGWELPERFVFIERGVSGARADRPQLDRLRAVYPDIDRLVIPKLDRFGRNARHLLNEFDALDTAGVELVSLSDKIDTSTPTGRLLRNLLPVLAEFEGAILAERVRDVVAVRAERGNWHGGPAPYGYRLGDDGLEPDPATAPIVLRAFELYVNGGSQRDVAREFGGEGLPAQGGGRWSQASVSKLLGNPVYAGRLRVNGREYAGRHEPIVSDELFRAVAERRQGRTKDRGGRRAKAGHLFTHGLLRCGLCGEAMLPRSAERPGWTPRYICRGRLDRGGHTCSQRPIAAPPIDAAVFDYFRAVGVDLERTKADLATNLDRQREQVQRLREDAEAELGKLDGQLTRLRRDYRDGKLTADEWRELRAEVDEDRAGADRQLAQLAERERQLDAQPVADAEAETLRRLDAIRAAIGGDVAGSEGVEQVRAALRRLFERFELYPVPAFGEPPTPSPQLARIERDIAEDEAANPPDPEPEDVLVSGEFVIVPEARAEAVLGEAWSPVFKRLSLDLADHKALTR